MHFINEQTNFWSKEFNFLKNSLLIISFVKTVEVTERVQDAHLSMKFIFLNVLLLSILRAALEIIHWTHLYPTQRWDWINLVGFVWQIAVFILFIMPFSSYILSHVASYFSHRRINFHQIFKVYFYLTFLFALSPLFDIIASYLGFPSFFYLPFASKSIITMGQLIEAFIIPILSCLILYQITRSTKIAIISTVLMGLLFPFILIGPDGVYLMSFIFNINGYYGLSNHPFHIILWAMENLWFGLLIIVILSTYLVRKFRQLNIQLNKFQLLIATLALLSIFMGYFLGGHLIPVAHIFSLILAELSFWVACILLSSRYIDNNLRLTDWIITMSIFWLLTIGFSLTLVVSYMSFFVFFAITLLMLIFIASQLRSASTHNPHSRKKTYLIYVLTSLIIVFSIILGATPTFFYYIEAPIGNFYYHIPLEIPALDIFLISLSLGFIISFIPYYYFQKRGLR